MTRPFNVDRTCHENGEARLRLQGELDLATVPKLAREVAELCGRGAARLTFDIQELDFIDSSGIHLLTRSRQLCKNHGCEFAITRGRPNVERLFALTGLSNQLAPRHDDTLTCAAEVEPIEHGGVPLGRARPG
jgi:anti-anti-sigma factor